MNKHEETWKQVSKILLQARDQLTPRSSHPEPASSAVGTLTGTLEEFEDFLNHNELELAWDALAAVAERVSVSSAFWSKLARAASLMNLRDKQASASERATPTKLSNKEKVIQWVEQLPDDLDVQGLLSALRDRCALDPTAVEPSDQDYEWPAEDLTEDEWRHFVAHGLRNELADPREDIYTLEDGVPNNEQG